MFILSVTRPLLEIFARNAEFFVFRRATRLEILILVLALSYLIPTVLVLLRFSLSKISQAAGNLFQGILIAALTLALILPGLNKHNTLSNNGFLAMLIFCCGFLGIGYFQFIWIRWFYRYLAPAILIVPLFFVFSPAIYRILLSSTPELPSVKIHSPTPLIFIVFDEFPVISLLDEKREIDAVRYPNFSKISKEWNWYRNASSVAEYTESAVPAILSGSYPGTGSLPVLKDYPQNLFTLLKNSHRLEVSEAITWLNSGTPVPVKNETYHDRYQSLISDLSVVYLHIILPEKYLQNLPSIGNAWGNFRNTTDKKGTDRKSVTKEPEKLLNEFLNIIQPSTNPAVYFLHVILPHCPWHLLPSGKDYKSRTYEGMILENKRWRKDESAVQRGYQRHLLQVGYIDHWLGKLIGRLKEIDLYDKSIIVLVADHGISFEKGGAVRLLSKQNKEEIIFVPLFIKAPGQKTGKILDWNVETIDILPTIAELMQFKLPWKVDGVSLVKNSPPSERPRRVCSMLCQTSYTFDPGLQADGLALKRKLNWFGTGNQDKLFRFGPCNELISKAAPISSRTPSNITVKLRDPNLFRNVSFVSTFIPTFIAGNLNSSSKLTQKIALGIAMNGIFQATTYSTPMNATNHAFDSLVPESALRPGNNQVQIYEISSCNEPPQLLREVQ